MTRTVRDWGSLVLAELDGREEPGTTARLIAEATGKGGASQVAARHGNRPDQGTR
jgi:hypothetical protein